MELRRVLADPRVGLGLGRKARALLSAVGLAVLHIPGQVTRAGAATLPGLHQLAAFFRGRGCRSGPSPRARSVRAVATRGDTARSPRSHRATVVSVTPRA